MYEKLSQCIKYKYYKRGFTEESIKNFNLYFDLFIEFFNIDSKKPLILDKKDFKKFDGKIVYRGYDTNLIKYYKYRNELFYGKSKIFSL